MVQEPQKCNDTLGVAYNFIQKCRTFRQSALHTINMDSGSKYYMDVESSLEGRTILRLDEFCNFEYLMTKMFPLRTTS
jgi:hypothetical protein